MYLRRVYGMPQMIVCFLVFLVFDLFFFQYFQYLLVTTPLPQRCLYTRWRERECVWGLNISSAEASSVVCFWCVPSQHARGGMADFIVLLILLPLSTLSHFVVLCVGALYESLSMLCFLRFPFFHSLSAAPPAGTICAGTFASPAWGSWIPSFRFFPI